MYADMCVFTCVSFADLGTEEKCSICWAVQTRSTGQWWVRGRTRAARQRSSSPRTESRTHLQNNYRKKPSFILEKKTPEIQMSPFVVKSSMLHWRFCRTIIGLAY